jgi:U3 small nucleolar RNA-associated protein MPP10
MEGNPDVLLPIELQSLSNLLEEFPETLALGNEELQATALNATKYAFDLCKLWIELC